MALCAHRLTYVAIAQKLGLSLKTVAGVCKEYAPLSSDQTVPKEMYLLAARDIQRVTGFWPLVDTAQAISKRAVEIMNGHRGRRLESLRLLP
ncbi:hypothetical protein GB927_020750 [Shinella sp. CPCC 100929]|uniref:Uncharacterized protein n=1 Tax=Shinella lacus TaxID=2654216 RepID=A0ABT1RBI6_9HYPH|nr:hypothetical protein [Shinella lacus]